MSQGVVTADWHLGVKTHSIIDTQTGLPSRLLDVWKDADKIVNYAIESKADFFWFLGDLFHTNHPTPIEYSIAVQLFGKLEDAGIHTIVFDGNHDFVVKGKSAATVLNDFRKWQNVEFIANYSEVVGHDWCCRIIPHGYDEKILKNIKSRIFGSSPEFLLCHTTFDGATVGSEEYMLASHVKSPPKGFNVDLVLSGHVHKAQELVDAYQKKVSVIYPGSITRVSFNEEKDDKIFGWFDTETLDWYDVSIPTRGMLTIDSNAETISEFEDECNCYEIKDKIVRVRVKGSLGRERIAQALVRFAPHNVVQIEHMNKSEKRLLKKTDKKIMNDYDIVDRILKDRLKDEKERQRALQIAKEVMNGS